METSRKAVEKPASATSVSARRRARFYRTTRVILTWGVATFAFTCLWSLVTIGNAQGNDIVLRIKEPHLIPAGTLVGTLELQSDANLVRSVWYSASDGFEWWIELRFVAVASNSSHISRVYEHERENNGVDQEWNLTLRGPAVYRVFLNGTPPANITASHMLLAHQTRWEALRTSPHGLFVVVAVAQYVAARLAYPPKGLDPENTGLERSTRWKVYGIDLFMHFGLALSAVYLGFYLFEGLPINSGWLFLLVFLSIGSVWIRVHIHFNPHEA